jgi:hypothetical protein
MRRTTHAARVKSVCAGERETRAAGARQDPQRSSVMVERSASKIEQDAPRHALALTHEAG